MGPPVSRDGRRVAGAGLFRGFRVGDRVVHKTFGEGLIVEVRDRERILVWFGGGDQASPDENVNGQIGLAWIEPRGGETGIETPE
jgi:hypothetical protein